MSKQPQDDSQLIKNHQKSNPVYLFLKNRDMYNFSVGDFLIRKVKKRTNDVDTWHTETVSHVSKIPKKWICIHEDEFGIKYIKPITSRGEELPHVIPLTEYDSWHKYEVDPDYADHIILSGDETFNPANQKKEEKNRRDRITRLNKKLAHPTKTADDIDALCTQLKVGDSIWVGWTTPDAVNHKITITSIRRVLTREVESKWEYRSTEWFYPRGKTWEIQYINRHNFAQSIVGEQMMGRVVITTEPHKYETI